MARIEAFSIDQVFVGQPAVLRLPAFDQHFTPELNPDVARVSADVFEDQATGASFYAAELTLSTEELAKHGDQALLPGMPIEAYLKTDERTPLSYLTKPLGPIKQPTWLLPIGICNRLNLLSLFSSFFALSVVFIVMPLDRKICADT